jgi:AcrR family transcriptional regulator
LHRQTVVDAAADLVDREGFESLTLARLAEVLDRHATSLYNHVAGLDGIRRDVALVGNRELGDALWEAALGRSGTVALEAIARAYRAYVLEHPGRYYALTTVAADDPEFVATGARTMQAMRAVLSSFGLDEEQTIHAHRVFAAAIRGFVLVEHSRGFVSWPDADKTFDLLITLFTGALAERGWPKQ